MEGSDVSFTDLACVTSVALKILCSMQYAGDRVSNLYFLGDAF